MVQTTGYTTVTSTRSNVEYQLRLHYNIVSRQSSSVVLDIDVEVKYQRYWSSNGAWVKIGNTSKSVNPQHIRGRWTWFASSRNSTRTGFWLKGYRVSVPAAATTVSIPVGFSNEYYAEGPYHTQNISVSLGGAYTQPTKTATGSTAQVTGNTLNKPVINIQQRTNPLKWSWSAVPGATKYKIEIYKDTTEIYSISGYTLTNATQIVDPSVTAKYTIYVTGIKSNGDKGATASVAFTHLPQPAAYNPASYTGADTIAVSTPITFAGMASGVEYRHKLVTSDKREFISLWSKTGDVYSGVNQFVGQTVQLWVQTRANGYSSAWVLVKSALKIGSAMTVGVSTTDSILRDNVKITVKAPVIDAYKAKQGGSVVVQAIVGGVTTELYRATRNATQIKELFELLSLRQLLINKKVNLSVSGQISIKATYTVGHLTASGNTTVQNIAPTIVSAVSFTKGKARYSADTVVPILKNTDILKIDIKATSNYTFGIAKIYMVNLMTKARYQIGEIAIGSTEKFISHKVSDLVMIPNVDYAMIAEISLTKPFTAKYNINLNLTSTNKVRIESLPNLTFNNQRNVRSNIIDKDIPQNAFTVDGIIKWSAAKEYLITPSIKFTQLDKPNSPSFTFTEAPLLVKSDTIKEQNVGVSIHFGDILLGEKWSTTQAKILQGFVPFTQGVLLENSDNTKVELTFRVREVFRLTPTGTPDTTELGGREQFWTMLFSANTISEPKFSSNTGAIVRYAP